MQVTECALLFLDVAPMLLDARRRVTSAVGRFSRFKTIVGERRCYSGYRKVDAEASLALDRWSIFEQSLRVPTSAVATRSEACERRRRRETINVGSIDG